MSVKVRKLSEPLIHTARGPINVTYFVPCHCVREQLEKGVAGRA